MSARVKNNNGVLGSVSKILEHAVDVDAAGLGIPVTIFAALLESGISEYQLVILWGEVQCSVENPSVR